MSKGTDINAIPEKLVEEVQVILHDEKIAIVEENQINYGYQLKTKAGGVINLYATGKIWISCQKRDHYERLKKLILPLMRNFKNHETLKRA